jgi:hypothetical protein
MRYKEWLKSEEKKIPRPEAKNLREIRILSEEDIKQQDAMRAYTAIKKVLKDAK